MVCNSDHHRPSCTKSYTTQFWSSTDTSNYVGFYCIFCSKLSKSLFQLPNVHFLGITETLVASTEIFLLRLPGVFVVAIIELLVAVIELFVAITDCVIGCNCKNFKRKSFTSNQGWGNWKRHKERYIWSPGTPREDEKACSSLNQCCTSIYYQNTCWNLSNVQIRYNFNRCNASIFTESWSFTT